MPHRAADIFATVVTWLMALLGVEHPAEVFNLMVKILIIWYIAKTIFGLGNRRRNRKKNEDWLYKAQKRQQVRMDNSLPPLAPEYKPHKKTLKEKRNERKGRSPTGWYFNEESGLWEPPANLKKESKDRWEWDENKRIWVDKYKKK